MLRITLILFGGGICVDNAAHVNLNAISLQPQTKDEQKFAPSNNITIDKISSLSHHRGSHSQLTHIPLSALAAWGSQDHQNHSVWFDDDAYADWGEDDEFDKELQDANMNNAMIEMQSKVHARQGQQRRNRRGGRGGPPRCRSDDAACPLLLRNGRGTCFVF